MNIEVLSLGELLVEIMRKEVDRSLDLPADFVGPFPSGAPAIFADAMARLGISTGFIGAVGNDDFGKCVIDRFKRDKVDYTHVSILDNHTTAVAFVMYFSDGSRKFLYHIPNAAAGQLNPDYIVPDYLTNVKFLHIMGSSLSVNSKSREACYKAVKLVKQTGGKVTFDPNLRPELLSVEQIREICQPVLDVCDIVMPRGEEACLIAGIDNSPEEACRALLARGVDIVTLKKGEKGSVIFTGDTELEVPSFKVNEVDPTGAGDCFGAGFIYGLMRGWDMEKTARFANAVGALATTKRGPMEGAPDLQTAMEFSGLK